jgi:hypothetical protein
MLGETTIHKTPSLCESVGIHVHDEDCSSDFTEGCSFDIHKHRKYEMTEEDRVGYGKEVGESESDVGRNNNTQNSLFV